MPLIGENTESSGDDENNITPFGKTLAKPTKATLVHLPGPNGFTMYVPTADIETIKSLFPSIVIDPKDTGV